MGKLSIIKEFWSFTIAHRNFWLLPVIAALLIFGVLIVASGSFSLAPFIYAIF